MIIKFILKFQKHPDGLLDDLLGLVSRKPVTGTPFRDLIQVYWASPARIFAIAGLVYNCSGSVSRESLGW